MKNHHVTIGSFAIAIILFVVSSFYPSVFALTVAAAIFGVIGFLANLRGPRSPINELIINALVGVIFAILYVQNGHSAIDAVLAVMFFAFALIALPKCFNKSNSSDSSG